jgi:hypothetical protein
MTRETAAFAISLLDGTAQVAARLLYGSGRHLMKAVRRRVKDIDAQMKPLNVRSGKGDDDWITAVPSILTPLLQNHLVGGKQ